MSSIEPQNRRGWTLALSPGVVLTLELSQNQKNGGNILVMALPGIDTLGGSTAGLGVAVTSGGKNVAAPVTPTPNTDPTKAGDPQDPEVLGGALYSMTLRAPVWKFLYTAAAPNPVHLRVFVAFDIATEQSSPNQAKR